jgi:hypothetical protein
MDEDDADELARQFPSEERSQAYWHGYNSARKVGRKRSFIRCPYQGDARKEFYAGVSDARFRM